MKSYIFSQSSDEKPTWADRFILFAILLNCVIIFLQESGIDTPLVRVIDAVCILLFIVEATIKIVQFGFKSYWESTFNQLDFILVILSLPALLTYILPSVNLGIFSSVLLLRACRVFRFFRLLKVFRNLENIVKSLGQAIKDSLPIFFGFLMLIVVFALISCSLFKDISPKYFGTPLDAIYSTFRICTTEGWYDIPDSLSTGLSAAQVVWVRIYFIFIVVTGGIIGLSLVNSIFVDAMVSNKNQKMKEEIENLTKVINELSDKIDRLQQDN